MKKSILATVTPKGYRKKHREGNATVVAAPSPTKTDAVSSYKNIEQPLKGISSVSSSASTTAPAATTIYKPVAKNNFKEKEETEHEDKCSSKDEGESSSEEDTEFDEEAVRKLLERKIEQAPAAKVIVSDAMMREALSEINARKSGISTTVKSSAQSMVTVFSSRGDMEHSITNTVSSVSTPSIGAMHHNTTGETAGHAKDDGGGGDAPTSNRPVTDAVSSIANTDTENNARSSFEGAEEAENIGCPLEKILEFLQAVMTKDYKRAFLLGKEVEKHEPNNELVLEYMTVLQKIIRKEKENDNNEESDSDTNKSSLGEAGEFTDELTTSSETDSVSEEDEDESSTESRSPSSTSGESDEIEEDHDDELDGKDSESNGVNEEGDRKNGNSTETLNDNSTSSGSEEDGEVQRKDNVEHTNDALHTSDNEVL